MMGGCQAIPINIRAHFDPPVNLLTLEVIAPLSHSCYTHPKSKADIINCQYELNSVEKESNCNI